MAEKDNPMRNIKLEKVTLNCGTGTEQSKLEKGLMLLKLVTGQQPVKTLSKKRIPAFGIRLKLPIGCKVTIRGKQAAVLLKKLLEPIGNTLKGKQMNPGSFSFGIKEYIEIPDMEYRREIGIMGFDVCVTLKRAGYRTKLKKLKRGHSMKNTISKTETADFMEKNFNTKIEHREKIKEK